MKQIPPSLVRITHGSSRLQGDYTDSDNVAGFGTTSQTGSNPAALNPVGFCFFPVTPLVRAWQLAMLKLWTELTFGCLQRDGIQIEKVTVTAKSRALKAEYTLELAQDLKAIHGLNAEAELANILSTEILAEINREVIRTIYKVAEQGAGQHRHRW